MLFRTMLMYTNSERIYNEHKEHFWVYNLNIKLGYRHIGIETYDYLQNILIFATRLSYWLALCFVIKVLTLLSINLF